MRRGRQSLFAFGGRKEYTDEDGHATKGVEWFGSKLRLLADVRHEVAGGYEVTDAKAGDGETLRKKLACGCASSDPPPPRITRIDM